MIEYLYCQEESAKLREAIVKNYVKPIVKKTFENYYQLNSAMLLVAQYWDDEAHDAVHNRLFFSVLRTPDIKAIFRFEFYEDSINLPELPSHSEIKCWARDQLNNKKAKTRVYWEENGEAIPAFAAFCKEGCHQLMRTSEAYTPYAVFRRQRELEVIEWLKKEYGIQPQNYYRKLSPLDYAKLMVNTGKGEDIEVEIVGKMLRPWLDGIKPEE